MLPVTIIKNYNKNKKSSHKRLEQRLNLIAIFNDTPVEVLNKTQFECPAV